MVIHLGREQSMSLIGKKRLPCGHQSVRLPEEIGIVERKCDTCRQTFYGYVSTAELASVKTGQHVLKIVWERDNPEPFEGFDPKVKRLSATPGGKGTARPLSATRTTRVQAPGRDQPSHERVVVTPAPAAQGSTVTATTLPTPAARRAPARGAVRLGRPA